MKVIGIGASAGGVEAILELFKYIPTDTGAAFVVIQHLALNQKSLMNEVIGRITEMPIFVVNQEIELQANSIYLMPGNHNISLRGNTLFVVARPNKNILNLPIDNFFHALGNEKKTDAIAVILSGSGSDGSRGIRTVKEQGGLILVQEPDTAQFDGMPTNAIRMNVADSVFPPKKIAEQISHITSSPIANGHENDEESFIEGKYSYYFERILQHIRTKVSISFKEYREPTLVRRMEKRMLVHQFNSMEEYYNYLLTNDQEVTALYQDFLIGVTRFFRNDEVFEYFKEHIIEQLLSNNTANGTIRIWIAACSTGEEAYSFAILIEDFLSRNNLQRDYKIFASDVDKTAIRFASEGLYDSSITADVPKALLNTYFKPEGSRWRVNKTLQGRILFAYQDVLSDPPFIRMNFISCRNFLIYLKPKTQRKVMTNFHFALNEEGIMLLGPSESLNGLNHAFDIVHKKYNYYNRKQGVKLLFRTPYRGTPNQIVTNRDIIKQAKINSQENIVDGKTDQLDPFTRYLIESLPVITLFLNQNLDILYLNGHVESFLNLPRSIARLNIKSMTSSDNARIFEDGVSRAFETNVTTTINNVILRKNKDSIPCNIRFNRISLEDWTDDVVVVEISIIDQTPSDDGHSIEQDDYLANQTNQLRKQLQTAQREVTQLRNEIDATTEELQASNRELMASNEELQSTNEELQSVNEELFTVNSEFQIKNQELTIANADINNLLKSTEIGTIFLDQELKIRKFTPAVEQQFKLLGSDIGRSITDFSSAFLDLRIADACKKVAKTNKSLERSVYDQDNNQYLMRVLPYRTVDYLTKGFVITFVNINKIDRKDRDIEQEGDLFFAWFSVTSDLVILLDKELSISDINQSIGNQTINDLRDSNVLMQFDKDQQQHIKVAIQRVMEQQIKHKTEVVLNKEEYQLSIIPISKSSKNSVVIMLQLSI